MTLDSRSPSTWGSQKWHLSGAWDTCAHLSESLAWGGVVGHFTVAEFSQAPQMRVVPVLLLQVRGFGPRAWRGHQTSRPLPHPGGRPAVSVHGLHSGAGALQRPDSLLPGPSHPHRPTGSPFSLGHDRAELTQPSDSYSLNSFQPVGQGWVGSPRRWVTRLGRGRVEIRLPDLWPTVGSVSPPYFPFLPPSAQWARQRWVDLRGPVRWGPPPAAPPARPLVEAGTVPGAGPCGRALSRAWVILGCTGLPHRTRSRPPSPHEQLPSWGGRRPPGPQAQRAGPRGQREATTPDPGIPLLPPESLAGSPRQQALWDPPGLGRPPNSP